jgi:hypothetical protein
VPERGEKIPSWGAGGAELEAAADAEHPKPISVRGRWDIVSSEGGKGGSVETSDRGDKEVNCSKRITM